MCRFLRQRLLRDWVLRGLVLICLTSLTPVAAADGLSKEEAKVQARAHFKLGVARYAAGDYEGALNEYRAAYVLLPVPDLLFNIAQAFRMKGDKSAAVDFYKKYLEAEPDGAASGEARMMVATLVRDLRAEEDARKEAEAKKVAEAEAEAKTKADAAAKAAEEARVAEARAAEARRQADLDTALVSKQRAAKKKPWVWATVGVAAVVVVGGAVTLGVLLSRGGPSDPSGSLGRIPGN